LHAEGQLHFVFYGELLHSYGGLAGVVPRGDRWLPRCQSDESDHIVA